MRSPLEIDLFYLKGIFSISIKLFSLVQVIVAEFHLAANIIDVDMVFVICHSQPTTDTLNGSHKAFASFNQH